MNGTHYKVNWKLPIFVFNQTNTIMKLELKKVKISLSQSEETMAFTSELYVDGIHAAHVSNAGHGGANRIITCDKESDLLINQAKVFCKTLPSVHDEGMELSMNLEFWISLEVGKISEQKEIEKKQKKCILIGDDKGTLTRYFKLQMSVDEILKQGSVAREKFKQIIANIRLKLKPGEQILNKNIPTELL